MKVLWITNILFPEVVSLMNNSRDLESSGGWMFSAAEMLSKEQSVELSIATTDNRINDIAVFNGKRITYYLIPLGKGRDTYNPQFEGYWRRIRDMVHPDIVHIHGTEFTHGLAYVKACGADNVVVSIQGVKKSCGDNYTRGLSIWDVYSNLSLHDLIRGSLFREKKKYLESAKYEKELIELVRNIIGRTTWDKAQVWARNNKARYFICNEILRDEFYSSEKWSYDLCRKHSIFISQANYPLKGFHFLIKAMPLILEHYPDAIIRVAGNNILTCNGIRSLFHFGGYGIYLRKQIERNNLSGKITFVGKLNASEMKKEYLSCNLFLCPSSIENSPNSLSEAQILGVPSIASYVGGIPDIMFDDTQNLYPLYDTELLAYKICQLFNMTEFRNMGMENVMRRHDKVLNTRNLLLIYDEIVKV